jgi:hypothetical protein
MWQPIANVTRPTRPLKKASARLDAMESDATTGDNNIDIGNLGVTDRNLLLRASPHIRHRILEDEMTGLLPS